MTTSQPEPDPQVPTCPRHPQVVAYVRCTRCGRPTCPQCQVQAPVGIHCVDCVREAARTAPQARTSLGAPAGGVGGALGESPVTAALVAACVVMFVVQWVTPAVEQQLWFMPAMGRLEPWRFVTAAFLHGGLTHLLFNMMALWTVGQPLERAMGQARYLALYLISAIGGSVGYLLLAQPSVSPMYDVSSSWFTPTVGASGAVFGLFGAELVLARLQRRDVRSLLVFLGINVAIGFMVPNIAWQAHLGGLVTGAAIAGLVWATRGRDRVRLQWPALAGVTVVLVALAVVKYALAPALVPGAA
ncbi:rhomboid family intramembrane serine protease [Arsenicicoccus dermatophilus]|uniref:rhomboid family intramembrane serine protease n=1 Tax=Arsenicicoccus dermatophilus TaxID=1076331 RepID=UPI0039173A8F